MNKLFWFAQLLLACVFLLAAALKLFAFSTMAAKSPNLAGLHGLFIFIGCCEVAGAFGLILPGITGIYPGLAAWAAAGLATIALPAGLFHLYRKEYNELIGAVTLLLLAAFVTWGRGFREESRAPSLQN